MTKTGSSSIQAALFFALNDPHFQYISCGEVNGSRPLCTLFEEAPESQAVNEILGLNGIWLKRYRRHLVRRFDRGLRKASHQNATLILSAERCWAWPVTTLEDLRDFMITQGYHVQIIAYVRPAKGWIESSFQEKLKVNLRRFTPIRPDAYYKLNYSRCVKQLDACFGRDSVNVYHFDPTRFPEGCVVRDFSQRLGIPINPNRIQRSNDGLSLDAVKLLYAYRRFGEAHGFGRQAYAENSLLMRKLALLRGPSLRFNSSIMTPLHPLLQNQQAFLSARMGDGSDVLTDIADDGEGIRTEDDLFSFSPQSLAWLARAVGQRVIQPTSGRGTARQVARQMACLRARHRIQARVQGIREFIRKESHHWLRCV